MGDGIHNALVTVGEFLPKLGAFLLIILVTWIVARIISTLVTKVLRRVGVDNMVAKNEYGRQAVTKMKGGVSGLLGTVVKVAVWLIGLGVAFRAFGPNPVSDYLAATVSFIPRLVTALLIVVLALWVASIVRNIVKSVLGGVSYGDTVATFVGGFIAVFGILAALSQLNIAPNIVNAIAYAALLAVTGIAIVGVGGGLIQPMRERWARTLDKVEQDAPVVRQAAQDRAAEKSRQETYQPYPTDAGTADARPTPQPAYQQASATGVSDDTAIYDPSGRQVTGATDPAVGGAPRPAGYSPDGYETR